MWFILVWFNSSILFFWKILGLKWLEKWTTMILLKSSSFNCFRLAKPYEQSDCFSMIVVTVHALERWARLGCSRFQEVFTVANPGIYGLLALPARINGPFILYAKFDLKWTISPNITIMYTHPICKKVLLTAALKECKLEFFLFISCQRFSAWVT